MTTIGINIKMIWYLKSCKYVRLVKLISLITKVKCIIIAITPVYCTFVVLPISIITPEWIQMTLGVTT